ncbi:tRNA (adenosine(37)-N6)-threonylcarbamoyltransferase complex dimerization subunit type 1 TsaB [Enterococcus sp. BWB1-3]|uniref:tRNA (adenosine(37)-N6)-threonylcarbamoyltransferase complex dimerization subunit type 1 TsaB n=1 Tax=unclassified Enterococcus TaxID=2608891 RepID=UPI00192223A7|nr:MULTISPECIES: tRNA (adenosine(37)-N6)-threonylcarbamoyltransferase complex dimerization subunit type 1 TsaB [unclassified Enterococcus]MBL1230485.1 tRNA (adenosine(37)-N6)-threonylcarbamoyltransferase complex dimerization subunit type 1 TsaB [Enterococcus sp. BWB1-3]MCB5950865.1 tRNA (adenosine(37)-N6)-threonylcarbamoyltransferase complex dimerization subunit type 1 TsaB [Enterococcus sp. BWT-B8]MCB5955306.1 tRNA (adenosine(37)-N6)-threonylcarbamoyltransferase complex dimerization subunit typ
MRILAIDTSNQTLSVAVCENNRILGAYTSTVQKNHSTTLMPAISKVMEDSQLKPKDLDRIVVAQGPGSYTGLRIGVTTAKTLAYSLSIDLVGISSLLTLAANCLNMDSLIVPLFDARRNNVYSGAYQYDKVNENWETVIPDQHISMNQWLEKLKDFPSIYFVGEDVEKFRITIEEKLDNAEINKHPQWQIPSGAVLAQLGAGKEPVKEVHHFLPEYLKRVEAEENWLKDHFPGDENYVEKI